MNTLQAQISELRDKTDRLYELVEQISDRIAQLNDRQPKPVEQSYSLTNFASGTNSKNRNSEYQLFHKDILVDDNSSTSSNNFNSDLAPDTQIRRLTAQLTAAYNRIAALEEQLLTYRINH